jgi:hypothetical protein
MRRPGHFQQGDLDGLCGVYSVLNAIRIAHATLRQGPRPGSPLIEGDEAEAIFLRLTRSISTRTIDDPVVWGINTDRLRRLLSVASRWLERNHGLTLEVARPFRGRRRVRFETVLKHIGDHLHKDGAAVIVGSRWPWNHWTVVRNIGKTRLVLADSGGFHYVPLHRGRLPTAPHARLISVNSVYLLSLRPKRPAARR